MQVVFNEVVAQAQALNILDRAKLVETLIETMNHSDPSIEAAWAVEAEDRIDALGRGEIELEGEPPVLTAWRNRQQ